MRVCAVERQLQRAGDYGEEFALGCSEPRKYLEVGAERGGEDRRRNCDRQAWLDGLLRDPLGDFFLLGPWRQGLRDFVECWGDQQRAIQEEEPEQVD